MCTESIFLSDPYVLEGENLEFFLRSTRAFKKFADRRVDSSMLSRSRNSLSVSGTVRPLTPRTTSRSAVSRGGDDSYISEGSVSDSVMPSESDVSEVYQDPQEVGDLLGSVESQCSVKDVWSETESLFLSQKYLSIPNAGVVFTVRGGRRPEGSEEEAITRFTIEDKFTGKIIYENSDDEISVKIFRDRETVTKIEFHDPELILQVKYGIYNAAVFMHKIYDIEKKLFVDMWGLSKAKEHLRKLINVLNYKHRAIARNYWLYLESGQPLPGFVSFVATEVASHKYSILELQKITKLSLSRRAEFSRRRSEQESLKDMRVNYKRDIQALYSECGLQGLGDIEGDKIVLDEMSIAEPLVITQENAFDYFARVDDINDAILEPVPGQKKAGIELDAHRGGIAALVEATSLDEVKERIIKGDIRPDEALLKRIRKYDFSYMDDFQSFLVFDEGSWALFQEKYDQRIIDFYIANFLTIQSFFINQAFRVLSADMPDIERYYCKIEQDIFLINCFYAIRFEQRATEKVIKTTEHRQLTHMEIVRYTREGWKFQQLILIAPKLIYWQSCGVLQGLRLFTEFLGSNIDNAMTLYTAINKGIDLYELFHYFEQTVLRRLISDPLESLIIILFGKCPKQELRGWDILVKYPQYTIGLGRVYDEMLFPLLEQHSETAERYDWIIDRDNFMQGGLWINRFLSRPIEELSERFIAKLPSELNLKMYFETGVLRRDISDPLEAVNIVLFGKYPGQRSSFWELFAQYQEETVGHKRIKREMLAPLVEKHPETAKQYASYLQVFTHKPVATLLKSESTVFFNKHTSSIPEALYNPASSRVIASEELDMLKRFFGYEGIRIDDFEFSKASYYYEVTASDAMQEKEWCEKFVNFCKLNPKPLPEEDISANISHCVRETIGRNKQKIEKVISCRAERLLSIPAYDVYFCTNAFTVIFFPKIGAEVHLIYNYILETPGRVYRSDNDSLSLIHIVIYREVDDTPVKQDFNLIVLDPKLRHLLEYGFYRWFFFLEDIIEKEFQLFLQNPFESRRLVRKFPALKSEKVAEIDKVMPQVRGWVRESDTFSKVERKFAKYRKAVVPCWLNLRSIPYDFVNSFLHFLYFFPRPDLNMLKILQELDAYWHRRVKSVREDLRAGKIRMQDYEFESMERLVARTPLALYQHRLREFLPEGDYRHRFIDRLTKYPVPVVVRKYSKGLDINRPQVPIVINGQSWNEYLLPRIGDEDVPRNFVWNREEASDGDEALRQDLNRNMFDGFSELPPDVVVNRILQNDLTVFEEDPVARLRPPLVIDERMSQREKREKELKVLEEFSERFMDKLVRQQQIGEQDLAREMFLSLYNQPTGGGRYPKLFAIDGVGSSSYVCFPGRRRVCISLYQESVFLIKAIYDFKLLGPGSVFVLDESSTTSPLIIEVEQYHRHYGLRVVNLIVVNAALKYHLDRGIYQLHKFITAIMEVEEKRGEGYAYHDEVNNWLKIVQLFYPSVIENIEIKLKGEIANVLELILEFFYYPLDDLDSLSQSVTRTFSEKDYGYIKGNLEGRNLIELLMPRRATFLMGSLDPTNIAITDMLENLARRFPETASANRRILSEWGVEL